MAVRAYSTDSQKAVPSVAPFPAYFLHTKGVDLSGPVPVKAGYPSRRTR